jgi:hypothetical protein
MILGGSLLGRQMASIEANSLVFNAIDLTNLGASDYVMLLSSPQVIGPSIDVPLSLTPGSNYGQIIHLVNTTSNVIYNIVPTPAAPVSWIGNPGDVTSIMWKNDSWIQLYNAGPGQNSWVDIPSFGPNIISSVQAFVIQDVAVYTRGQFSCVIGTPVGIQPCLIIPPGLRGDFEVICSSENASSQMVSTVQSSSIDGIVYTTVPVITALFTVQVKINYVITG